MTTMAEPGPGRHSAADAGVATPQLNASGQQAALLSEVDTGFPGRLVGGVCLVAAPILALVGTGLAVDLYSEAGGPFASAMANHPMRGMAGVNLSVASIMLALFVVVVLARAITGTHPRLGRTGGVLTMLGLMGPMFFEGIFWGASRIIVQSPSHIAVAATLINRANVVPASVDNISGPCLFAGFILLGLGAAKSGLLSRWRAAALALTCLLPFGFISGYMVISLVAFLGLAVAVVPLGVRVLRGRLGMDVAG